MKEIKVTMPCHLAGYQTTKDTKEIHCGTIHVQDNGVAAEIIGPGHWQRVSAVSVEAARRIIRAQTPYAYNGLHSRIERALREIQMLGESLRTDERRKAQPEQALPTLVAILNDYPEMGLAEAYKVALAAATEVYGQHARKAMDMLQVHVTFH